MNAEPSRAVPDRRRSPLAWFLLGFVRIYQATTPFRGPRCRFYPTCSAYAVEAIRVHGGFKGFWLAARRIGRCHPWNPGGVDYVPSRRDRHVVEADQTSAAFEQCADIEPSKPRTDEVAGAHCVAHRVRAAKPARRK